MPKIIYVELPEGIMKAVFDDCIYLNTLYYKPGEENSIPEIKDRQEV